MPGYFRHRGAAHPGRRLRPVRRQRHEGQRGPASGEGPRGPASGERQRGPASGEGQRGPASGDGQRGPASGEGGAGPYQMGNGALHQARGLLFMVPLLFRCFVTCSSWCYCCSGAA